MKILELHPIFQPESGDWCIPAGFMEWDEHPQQTAIREIKEETGLDVSIIRMIGFYDEPGRDPEKDAVSMAFLVKIRDPGQEIQISHEATELKWFDIDKLPEKIGFDHAKIITDAIKLQKTGA